MPKIIYGDQGDKAWHQHRAGSVGGSSIKSLVNKYLRPLVLALNISLSRVSADTE